MHLDLFTSVRFSYVIKKNLLSSFRFNVRIESYPTATARCDVTHAPNSRVHARKRRVRIGGNHWRRPWRRISRKLYRRCIRGACAAVRSPGCPFAAKSSIVNQLSLRNADHVSPIPLPRSAIQPHHRQRRRVCVNVIANAEWREYNHISCTQWYT